jgi:uncharacterized protein with PIN domain
MAKCDSCKSELKEGLLGKIAGASLRIGKKVFKICPNCQRVYNIEELKKRLK